MRISVSFTFTAETERTQRDWLSDRGRLARPLHRKIAGGTPAVHLVLLLCDLCASVVTPRRLREGRGRGELRRPGSARGGAAADQGEAPQHVHRFAPLASAR